MTYEKPELHEIGRAPELVLGSDDGIDDSVPPLTEDKSGLVLGLDD